MQINPTFVFASGSTQADELQFGTAAQSAINAFDTLFQNTNVTLNIVFAYGESFKSVSGNTITYQTMPTPQNGSEIGTSQVAYGSLPYAEVLTRLYLQHSGVQAFAYQSLPTPANNPFAADTMWLSNPQLEALGFSPGASIAGEDGVIGIASNEELQTGGFSAD